MRYRGGNCITKRPESPAFPESRGSPRSYKCQCRSPAPGRLALRSNAYAESASHQNCIPCSPLPRSYYPDVHCFLSSRPGSSQLETTASQGPRGITFHKKQLVIGKARGPRRALLSIYFEVMHYCYSIATEREVWLSIPPKGNQCASSAVFVCLCRSIVLCGLLDCGCLSPKDGACTAFCHQPLCPFGSWKNHASRRSLLCTLLDQAMPSPACMIGEHSPWLNPRQSAMDVDDSRPIK